MRNVTVSLADCLEICTILPLSISDLKQAGILPNSIDELMFKGSYPHLYKDEQLSIERFYHDYINTCVEREMQTLANLPYFMQFHNFLIACANHIGMDFDISTLATEVQIDIELANQWFSQLTENYTVYTLSSHSLNQGTTASKLYFYDTGIACQLLRIDSIEKILKMSALREALFENFVITECAKWYHQLGKEPALYFWRDEQKHEIDLIVDLAGKLVPIEIKSADTVRQNMTDVLSFWHELTEHPLNQSYVVYTGPDSISLAGPQFISWQNIPELFTELYK